MRKYIVFIIILFFGQAIAAQNHETARGTDGYRVRIYVSYSATPQELRAAELLHGYIENSDVELDPFYDARIYTPKVTDRVIYVGGPSAAFRMGSSRKAEIHDDGFLLYSDGKMALIYGRSEMSVYYGAARLLELMGFRQFNGKDRYLNPLGDKETIVVEQLPVVNVVSNPSFTHREMWYHYAMDSSYADWHGLQQKTHLHWADGMFVHTFQKLIPAADYFEEHPEWFSEINGRRVRDGQLCLSNPHVLDTLCAHLALRMQEEPDAQIWSVSNNDNINACQCDHCRHMDSLYGGPSGTLIHFINQVARRFPDKTISTLAYQYTRRAPQPVNGYVEKPDSNVNIMLCSIECGRQEAIATAEGEAAFRRDVEEWTALTSNIYFWDYVVQFRNFWDPFPNLHVLQPNLKFFHDHGIRWMFEQGSGAQNRTSWMELRQYLIAELLWNVNADADSLIHDFCYHYYGPAAQPVENLYREMERSLKASGQWLNIYGYPIDAAKGYLAPQHIARYQQLIAQAYALLRPLSEEDNEAAVAKLAVYKDRVRYLELSVDYAVLELTMAGVLPMDDSFVLRADRFVQDGKKLGLQYLHEMGYSLDEYRADIDNYLAKSLRPNLAKSCPVTLKAEPKPQYYSGGAAGLTDGRAGILNYHNCWLGFYEDTLDAVIDLGRRQRIDSVSLDFFFYPLSWIFLPQRIEFYISKNGADWQLVDTLMPQSPEVLAVPQIKTFTTQPIGQRARYLRVVAIPLETIPSWHRATGNAPWIFTDEIVVR